MRAFRGLFTGKTWRYRLFRIVLVLTICTIPFWYHYKVVYVDGISMIPTYDDGQWTLMQRTRSFDDTWVPDRFDVIGVWSDKDQVLLCKRVIGLPGETVEIIEGTIFIDGNKLSDSFSKGYIVYFNFIDPNIESTVINEGEVWVIGDNREDSIYGHFPIKEIRGKIVLY